MGKQTTTRTNFLCGAVILLAGSAASAAPAIYDLGTLGGEESHGSAVNNAGQVAGYSYLTTDITGGARPRGAFRYDGTPGSGGVMRDLGSLGGTISLGFGVNDTGQVAGYSTLTNNSATHAFRYDGTPGSGGVMRDLGALGGTYSNGQAINDAGQVAGYGTLTNNSATHAFRYDGTPGSGGVMHDLGTLGGTYSYAYGINGAGQVAGYSPNVGNYIHAFRYDGTPGSGGVMRDLSTLGGGDSYGYDVNDAGQVAGVSYTDRAPAQRHAFRYDGTPGSGGVMRDLGTLGGWHSSGYAINDAGHVVGKSDTTVTGDSHPFLYTGTPGVDGQMIDLETWLDANNPAEGAKWTLSEARGISDTGWITGWGTYDPDGAGGVVASDRAYLLDASSLVVPEPSSLTLLTLAVPALLRRRRVSL